MGANVQTTSHEGLRTWFELLRTSREGLMPKYWVARKYQTTHCSNPECESLTIGELASRNWGLRQAEGTGRLYAFRHNGLCPWMQHVDDVSQNSFTTKPLERAYVYWAQLEHKLNHK